MSGIAEVHIRALKIHESRVALAAENIANANMPNYKAKAIDVKKAMAMSGGDLALSSVGSRTLHAQGSAPGAGYVTPSGPSLDGNTVDVNSEKLELMDAQQRYEQSLSFISGAFSARKMALKGN